MMKYDIVGDVHGCADKLSELLHKMDYQKKGDVYCHPERKVIFLGDFIDRGPYQKETLKIVRPMIESGEAMSVMGNHEFNAICYSTKLGDDYVRPHSEKNRHQHEIFLDQFPYESDEYYEAIDWFKSLPVYLDFEQFGVVHACWCEESLQSLDLTIQGNRLKDEAYTNYADNSHAHYHALEKILKGPEVKLPEALYFKDKDGHERKHARFRWWADMSVQNYERLEFSEAEITDAHKDMLTSADLPEPMTPEGKVIFVGHYWLQGDPKPLSDKVACVDYSVAKDGKMTAYRYNGENKIHQSAFIWV